MTRCCVVKNNIESNEYKNEYKFKKKRNGKITPLTHNHLTTTWYQKLDQIPSTRQHPAISGSGNEGHSVLDTFPSSLNAKMHAERTGIHWLRLHNRRLDSYRINTLLFVQFHIDPEISEIRRNIHDSNYKICQT